MKKNVASIKSCFGCGVCSIACSKKIISIELNSDGFYTPVILKPDLCNHCGLCVEVCSYSHSDIANHVLDVKSFASWSNDSLIRQKCSSGGVGFEIAKKSLENSWQVCAVRYDAVKNRAEHYIASTLEELIPSIGSKYIQSYTLTGFSEIDKKKKYLITGTPCQIDSFRRYIKTFRCEDNFILLDFFCHGVPSKLMWDKYVHHVEKKVGKLTYVSWRNKFTGWHDSWAMAIDGEEHGVPVNWHESYNMLIREKKSYLNSRLSEGDPFYKLFLSDLCLGKACYNHCRFKCMHSSADIRIGDLWGKTYQHNEQGVSGVIAFTERGMDLLQSCNVTLVPHQPTVVCEGQMENNPVMPLGYSFLLKTFEKSWISIRVLALGARVLVRIRKLFKKFKCKWRLI